MSDLIYEERIFYKRIVRKVRIEYAIDETISKEFDVSTLQDIKSLEKKVSKFFELEVKSYNLKSLSFVLRNFLSIW